MTHPDKKSLDDIAAGFCDGLEGTRAFEQSVPDRFRFETQAGGERVSLTPRALVGDKIAYGRVTRLDGGDTAQVLNIGVVPRLATTLPILGLELLSFAGGVQLVVVDFFQTASSDVSMQLQEVLKAARAELQSGFEVEARPEWGDSIFSDDAIIIRPGSSSRTRVTAIVQPLMRVLDRYVAAIGRYEPTMLRGIELRRRRRREYLDTQAKQAPSHDVLARLEGEEWNDDFAHGFLYPDWLHGGDTIPPWLDDVSVSPG